MQAQHEIRTPVPQVLALLLAVMAALLLAGMAGYLLRGANSSSSTKISVGPPAIGANPAVSAVCEGYACTVEGERELSERQAVQAAVERNAAQEEREVARQERHASRDL